MNRVISLTAALMVLVAAFAVVGQSQAEAGLFSRSNKCCKPAKKCRTPRRSTNECCEPACAPASCCAKPPLLVVARLLLPLPPVAVARFSLVAVAKLNWPAAIAAARAVANYARLATTAASRLVVAKPKVATAVAHRFRVAAPLFRAAARAVADRSSKVPS